MKVKELIDNLNKLPQDADIFYGIDVDYKNEFPSFELYSLEIKHYDKVRSYGSSSPRWNYEENVVVLTNEG